MTLQNFSSENGLFLALCSEATLNHWVFEGQKLSVNLTTYDDDELIIFIETDTVHSFPLYPNKNLNICRVVIQDMHEILDSKNGYYIPPKSFNDLMKLSGKSYSLYYGRKNVMRYNVAFIGSESFLSCPIASLDSNIKWKLND
ncbi:hypothetical protein [Erwinia sorbitola]|uniref:Uncharacterized protein n=1 Tax=Erwinia sorbitola TaxID=2681984 RepID=A0ABW9RGT2_9GAMM|nr:hypothetical protein [Erwinia sorbitola]MTD29434.1 hypothetical protein [Erwinia sorbitola]